MGLADEVKRFFASDGPLSKALDGHEPRLGQLELALKVSESLESGGNLVAEAGTGTGKTLAYLVPAVLFAEANPNRHIFIATKTIVLQDQLLKKDIPLVRELLNPKRAIVSLKGRSNYLSLRRLKLAIEQPQLFHEAGKARNDLKNLRTWASTTQTGERADLMFETGDTAWELAQSDWQNCRFTKCPNHKDCFYFKATRTAAKAGVIIVNHALFFTRLAFSGRRAQGSIDFSSVILDEAHEIEDIATEQFSQTLSDRSLTRVLRRIDHNAADGNKGILPRIDPRLPEAIALMKAIEASRHQNELFFSAIDSWFDAQRGREAFAMLDTWPCETEPLCKSIKELGTAIQEIKTIAPDAILDEIDSLANRIFDLGSELDAWFAVDQQEYARWVEEQMSSKGSPFVQMKRAPLDIGPILRKHLYQKGRPVIMTSATIATDNSFDFFLSRVGIDDTVDVKKSIIESPFQYHKQMTLELHDNLPDPSMTPTDAWINGILPEIVRGIQHTEGGCLILFTSIAAMKNCHAKLVYPCKELRRRLLIQGQGPMAPLIHDFSKAGNGVMLGVESFWQGIDIRGTALSRVIVTRLPFESPNDPLTRARSSLAEESGSRYFMEVSVPRALVRMKQGWGRLIRSSIDCGVISILDPRILTKRYGERFLACFPDCPTFRNGVPWNQHG
jgi:ATP-dependent DNA helicase DinG